MTEEKKEELKRSSVDLTRDKIVRFVEVVALTPKPIKELVEMFGVSKSRINQWKADDGVREAIMEKRAEAFDYATITFKGLAEKAVKIVQDKIEEGEDVKIAMDVLKGIGICITKQDINVKGAVMNLNTDVKLDPEEEEQYKKSLGVLFANGRAEKARLLPKDESPSVMGGSEVSPHP